MILKEVLKELAVKNAGLIKCSRKYPAQSFCEHEFFYFLANRNILEKLSVL
jgi:hypothetical protein